MSRRFSKGYAGSGILHDPGRGIVLDWGTSVPSDTTAGYVKGALFVKIDGVAGSQLFLNVGTSSSCNFDAIAGTVDLAGLTATATELNTLSGILATTAELNRIADVSTRLVAAGSTLSVTVASHADKVILLDTATGSVCTLPAATGTGARFLFRVSVLATSNSHIIKVANASDIIQGVVSIIDTDTAGTITGFATAADSDTITLNRSTTGSVMRGEWIELLDVATNLFLCRAQLSNTGSGATPFSATV